MDKGALRVGKEGGVLVELCGGSRSDRDRQGHEEQGGPDREAERQCYYSVSFPGQLPPWSAHVRYFPLCPLDYLFTLVSQPQVTVKR